MLLGYQFSTDPGPVQASAPGNPASARINISVTCPEGVYCNEIEVAVPIGDDGSDLAASPPTASLNTAAWSVGSALPKRDPSLGPSTWASYTFRCKSDVPADWHFGYSLVLGLETDAVNVTPGQFQCVIRETSGSDPSTLKRSDESFTLEKIAPEFYLRNLVATTPASTVPATEFAAGATIALEWESNGTWFELYAKDDPAPLHQGRETSCQISGLETDTTLVLVASVTGDPSRDAPSEGYETISLYDAITVTVSNPALTPSALTVSGPAAVGSLASVGLISGAGLNLTGKASILGSLQSAGLDATSSAGAVKLMTAIQNVIWSDQSSGSAHYNYTALTDGLLFAMIAPQVDNPSKRCFGDVGLFGTVFAKDGVHAQGGNFYRPGKGGKSMPFSSTGHCLLPVPAGTDFGIAWTQDPDNEIPVLVRVYWMPLGEAPGYYK